MWTTAFCKSACLSLLYRPNRCSLHTRLSSRAGSSSNKPPASLSPSAASHGWDRASLAEILPLGSLTSRLETRSLASPEIRGHGSVSKSGSSYSTALHTSFAVCCCPSSSLKGYRPVSSRYAITPTPHTSHSWA